MEDTTFNLIEHWKKMAPRPDEQMPFGSIMKALDTPYSAVEFREEVVGRWGVSIRCLYLRVCTDNYCQFYVRGQRKLAEFSFAGVVASADDHQTGNLVPDGEDIPEGLDTRKRYDLLRSIVCSYLMSATQAKEG